MEGVYFEMSEEGFGGGDEEGDVVGGEGGGGCGAAAGGVVGEVGVVFEEGV